jgi:hypothetical protein
MKKVIVRTYSAGVFYCDIESRSGKEAVITNAVRLWYWKGANSLSQLAMEGVKYPDECKFSVPTAREILTEVIEIIETTEIAQASIEGVRSWK